MGGGQCDVIEGRGGGFIVTVCDGGGGGSKTVLICVT